MVAFRYNLSALMFIAAVSRTYSHKFEFNEEDSSWAAWTPRNYLSKNARSITDVATKPNIIFFHFDDWGWNDVGYHNEDVQTPNLDNLANNGLKMEQSYAQAICGPSRSALLTGMYPLHIGKQIKGEMANYEPQSLNGLILSRRLLPEYLKELDYSTHIVGKWHLGSCNEAYLPTRRGFDSHYGIMLGNSWSYSHAFHAPPFPYDFFENDIPLSDVNEVGDKFQMDLYRNKTISLITEHARKQNSDNPLFLYFASTSPHVPVAAPVEYLDLYPNVDDSEKRRTYLAMVTHMDNVVGEIVATLEKTGLMEDTIIIVQSDNGGLEGALGFGNQPFYGGGSNDPLRGRKTELYEGGVRVVSFIYSPRLANSGITNNMFHIVDWLPTLITAAGGNVTDYPELEDVDGIDQFEMLFEGGDPKRQAFIYNIREEEVDGQMFYVGAIRYGRWKLINQDGNDILEPVGSYYLFDLQEDPNETTDLFEAEPEVAEKMIRLFMEAAVTMVPNTESVLDESDFGVITDDVGVLRRDFCTTDGRLIADDESESSGQKATNSYLTIFGTTLLSSLTSWN